MGGVVDELDDGLTNLNGLDVTWGFDLDAFLDRCSRCNGRGCAADVCPSSKEPLSVASTAQFHREVCICRCWNYPNEHKKLG